MQSCSNFFFAPSKVLCNYINCASRVTDRMLRISAWRRLHHLNLGANNNYLAAAETTKINEWTSIVASLAGRWGAHGQSSAFIEWPRRPSGRLCAQSGLNLNGRSESRQGEWRLRKSKINFALRISGSGTRNGAKVLLSGSTHVAVRRCEHEQYKILVVSTNTGQVFAEGSLPSVCLADWLLSTAEGKPEQNVSDSEIWFVSQRTSSLSQVKNTLPVRCGSSQTTTPALVPIQCQPAGLLIRPRRKLSAKVGQMQCAQWNCIKLARVQIEVEINRMARVSLSLFRAIFEGNK